VNVFQFDRKLKRPGVDLRADLVEGGANLFGFGRGDQSDFGEHPGVGLAGADVLAVQPLVEGNGFRELFNPLVRAAVESPAPGLAHGRPSSRLRLSGLAKPQAAYSMILLNGYSTMPLAPAALSCGTMCRTVSSSMIVLTATNSASDN